MKISTFLFTHTITAILSGTVIWAVLVSASEEQSRPLNAAALPQDFKTQVKHVDRYTKRPYENPNSYHMKRNEYSFPELTDFSDRIAANLLAHARTDSLSSLSWLFSDEKDSIKLRRAYSFERREVVRRIFMNIAAEDVSECLKLLFEHDDSSLISEALATLLERRPQVIFPEVVLSNLSNYVASEQTVREVERTILQKWVLFEPNAAKNWTLQNQADDSRQASILAVAEGELITHPQSALDWVESNIDETVRSQSIEYLLDIWASRDPDAAGGWLQNHIDEPAIENALQNYALKINDQDPIEAKQWVAEIQDDALRNKVIDMLGYDEPLT